MENTSKVYYNGSLHETNNCGYVEVIGKFDNNGYYLVRFGDGTVVKAHCTNIKNGNVKNHNRPSIYGFGYIGIGKWRSRINGKITKEYALWASMIQRCYDPKYHERQPTYKDCTVDKRWWSYQQFAEDIQKLEGYDNWLNKEDYQLDKDIKIKGNKIYSIETSMFVKTEDNLKSENKRQSITGLTYIGTRKSDGYTEEFINQHKFAKNYQLNVSGVNLCIKGVYKSTGGWTFQIKKESA